MTQWRIKMSKLPLPHCFIKNILKFGSALHSGALLACYLGLRSLTRLRGSRVGPPWGCRVTPGKHTIVFWRLCRQHFINTPLSSPMEGVCLEVRKGHWSKVWAGGEERCFSNVAIVILAPVFWKFHPGGAERPYWVMLSQPHGHIRGLASQGSRNWPLLGGFLGLSSLGDLRECKLGPGLLCVLNPHVVDSPQALFHRV